MKKLISLLIIPVFFAACSAEKQSSNIALTKSKNLTGLKLFTETLHILSQLYKIFFQAQNVHSKNSINVNTKKII